jgi:CDP-diacylglycerol--serine O-phosphatidyltransferase
MFFGYCAIILASKHNFEWAVTMVVLAGILDGLDGRIARMTGTTSEFGKELDSLSDFLSFGLAPALVLYHWGFAELGKAGWLLVFLLPVAGALRLARFNVQSATGDKRFFVGMPIPAAAAAAVLPLYFLAPGLSNLTAMDARTLYWIRIGCLAYVVSLAWLMVSTVRFRSFKDSNLRARQPSVAFFFIAVIVVLIALNPPVVLLAMAVTYALSGPAGWLWGKFFSTQVRDRSMAEPPLSESESER